MRFEEGYYFRAKQQAQEWLFQIPGVVGVALGPKIVAGKLTAEPAIQVFVHQKRGAHELPPGEAIPPLIDEIKTDVIESGPPQIANGQVHCATGKITGAKATGTNDTGVE